MKGIDYKEREVLLRYHEKRFKWYKDLCKAAALVGELDQYRDRFKKYLYHAARLKILRR